MNSTPMERGLHAFWNVASRIQYRGMDRENAARLTAEISA